MAMNRVQFQNGLSMAGFLKQYGTVEQCHAALVASRWPAGFVCPHCGKKHHSTFIRDGRQHWQCQACQHQTTVIAGTNGGTVREAAQHPTFLAVNTVLGNLKTAISGTYHAFNFRKYADRYLSEVQYRFNRRFDLGIILKRLARAAATTAPCSESAIRATEASN